MRFLCVATIALALAGCPSSAAQAPHKTLSEETHAQALPTRTWVQKRPVIIRHARLFTGAGPVIENGAVVFAQGKIVAAAPDGTVQTPGRSGGDRRARPVVTPGIIDAHSHLGVYPSPQTQGNSDGNEATNPVTAEVNAKDGFWPQDPGLRRAAAGGVTSLLVLPGSPT